MFSFYLEVVNKMRQVSITISEFTQSIKQPCGRCGIKFIPQFTVLSCQMLSIYYFSLPDEGGGNEICQFHCLFLKILTEAGRFIILWIS